MSKVRDRPRRTLPVAALDVLLATLAAISGLVGRVARLLPVRRGDRMVAAGVLAAVLVAVVGTGLLIIALVRAPERLAPLGVAPPPSPAAEAGVEGGPDAADGSATPPASSPLVPPPAEPPGSPPSSTADRSAPRSPAPPAPLAARYATENVTLLNYVASVTITNPGPGPSDGWTLAITLPRQTQSVAEVNGAAATRDGATWTFVPDKTTRQVPAGGSVQVRFRVDGTAINSAPIACVINGRPCDPPPPADR